MISVLNKFKNFTVKHPLLRNMLVYGSLLPLGSFIQQNIEKQQNYDFKCCFRYAIYGFFVSAPCLYNWVRLTSAMWPETNFRVGIIKAIIEQISYGPLMLCCFFFTMSMLEGRSLKESTEEVKFKFFPTYKVGCCFWPSLQTLNYALIRQHNRVVFASVCSLTWTIFLAYMKRLHKYDVI